MFFCFSNVLECCKCMKIIFNCTNDLVVLRILEETLDWFSLACSQTELLAIAKLNPVE